MDESIFQEMLSGPRLITTLLVAKPNVVRRHFGKLLKKVTLTGFSVVGCKLKTLSAKEAASIVPGPVQNVSSMDIQTLIQLAIFDEKSGVRKMFTARIRRMGKKIVCQFTPWGGGGYPITIP